MHQKTDKLTCGLDVESFIQNSLESYIKKIQIIVGKVEQVQEKLRGTNFASENKPAFDFWIAVFVIRVVEVNFGYAFMGINPINSLDGVVDFVELFLMVKCKTQDSYHFQVLLQASQFLGEKSQTL